MISPVTKDKIIETARIEEVVGDFVTLKKKSGAYLIGLCPFHTEKTPSFTVTPARGIYKCFGCGKAGNSVDFIMEHEKLTFPESLRYLANKYKIEIEEEKISDEEKQKRREDEDVKESMLVLNQFATRYFNEYLMESEEGKAIGLSYFRERKFTDETIRKFQLGFSPSKKNTFSKKAIESGFKAVFLAKTGLAHLPENFTAGLAEDESGLADRFRERVMFPIHGLTGRVIGFGGRILSTEKNLAKYVNSPESEIYHKSNVLFGLYFAKKEIVNQDLCYLVEGYTDVISLSQAGIENVVASSGTSLTVEQIRLIARFTTNVCILYDGDMAGIKASMRGIDMILEEGLNVKIVSFPDGEDPDSYCRKNGGYEMRSFIKKQAVDFIHYKAQMLVEESAGDPIKKASGVRSMVESIARLTDAITRAEYAKSLSSRLGLAEQMLVSEINLARNRQMKGKPGESVLGTFTPVISPPQQEYHPESMDYQEKDLLRVVFRHGHEPIQWEEGNASSIFEFFRNDLDADGVVFENPIHREFWKEYEKAYHLAMPSSDILEERFEKIRRYFTYHENSSMKDFAIHFLIPPPVLHNWGAHRITIPSEKERIGPDVKGALISLKQAILQGDLRKIEMELKTCKDPEMEISLLRRKMFLDEIKMKLAKERGTVIIR